MHYHARDRTFFKIHYDSRIVVDSSIHQILVGRSTNRIDRDDIVLESIHNVIGIVRQQVHKNVAPRQQKFFRWAGMIGEEEVGHVR